MNREVCEHFNPVDLPCAKCVEKRKSEAAFLADELEAPLGTIIGAELHRRAAAELRRLYAENERLKTMPMKYRRMEFNAQLQAENDGLRAQRDALLEVLKYLDKEFRQHGRQHWPEAVRVRAAIALVEGRVKAVEGEKR